MKKAYKSVLSAIILGGVWLKAAPVYAAGLCPDDAKFSGLCGIDQTKIQNLPGKIVNILLILAIVLALIFLVYGGIKWITSGGDKAKVEAARSHLTAAVVGLILALLAYFILNVVVYLFTGQTFSTFDIPTLF